MSNFTNAQLGDICDINPDALSDSSDANKRYRYIDLSSVNEQKIDLAIESQLFSALPSRARRKVRYGDVLLGTVRPNLKNFAFVSSSDEDLVASTGFAVLRSKEKLSNAEFIFHLINSDIVGRQLNALVTGSNYPAVNVGQVAELLVPCPPLPEQKKIAEILSGIDKRIVGMLAKIDKFVSLHQVALEQKIQELICKADMTKISSISEKIMDYRGKSPPKHDSGVPLITAKNVRKGFIDDNPKEFIREDLYQEWMSRGIPIPGDILITTEAPLGNAAPAPSERFAIGQRVICVSPNRTSVSPEFLLACMQTDFFQKQLTASSTGSTVSGVRQGVLLDCDLPLPCMEEQRKIGDFDAHSRNFISSLK